MDSIQGDTRHCQSSQGQVYTGWSRTIAGIVCNALCIRIPRISCKVDASFLSVILLLLDTSQANFFIITIITFTELRDYEDELAGTNSKEIYLFGVCQNKVCVFFFFKETLPGGFLIESSIIWKIYWRFIFIICKWTKRMK